MKMNINMKKIVFFLLVQFVTLGAVSYTHLTLPTT